MNIFSKLWKVEPTELLTSFDGLGIFRPWYSDVSGKYWKTGKGWWHIDQNVQRIPQRVTVQALVTLYDQNEYTGSTCLIPDSHKLVKKKLTHLHKDDGHFVRVNPRHYNTFKKMDKILVCCKKGDMVMWDSRTIHCSSPALMNKQEMIQKHVERKYDDLSGEYDDITDNNELNYIKAPLLRAVCMVCMTPRDKATGRVLSKRVEAYINGYTLSHWPHEYYRLANPRWNDDERNNINDADSLTLALIGA